MSQKGKVYVQTVVKPTATKISEAVNGKNTKLNQMKISRNIFNVFSVLQSEKTGKLKTGLSKYVDSPYKDTDLIDLPNKDFGFVVGKKEILLQHLKEIEYNLPLNYLTDEAVDRGKKGALDNPTFYQTFKYKLNDGLTIFDLNNMNDDLAYHAMLESKYFANSKKELDENKFPFAVHYISLENESDELKYKKKYQKDKAKGALTFGDLANPEMQRKFVKLLLPQVGKGNLSDMQAYNALSSAIEDNVKLPDGSQFIDKLSKQIDEIGTPKGREVFEASVLLQELINNRVVAEKQGTYTFLSKDIVIGQNKSKAIDFILNPEKQDLLEEMEQLLKTKKVQYA
jgi:hypothetical protein